MKNRLQSVFCSTNSLSCSFRCIPPIADDNLRVCTVLQVTLRLSQDFLRIEETDKSAQAVRSQRCTDSLAASCWYLFFLEFKRLDCWPHTQLVTEASGFWTEPFDSATFVTTTFNWIHIENVVHADKRVIRHGRTSWCAASAWCHRFTCQSSSEQTSVLTNAE
jgi:hypothetical protein